MRSLRVSPEFGTDVGCFHFTCPGNIRLHADDLNADGRPELVIEMLRHPGSGTGYLSQRYNLSIVQCRHLHCYPIWEQVLGAIERSGGAGRLWYKWSGSSFRFAEQGQGRYPKIEEEQYKVRFDQLWSAQAPSGTLSAYVLTSTRVIYRWDGARYAPAMRWIHALSPRP